MSETLRFMRCSRRPRRIPRSRRYGNGALSSGLFTKWCIAHFLAASSLADPLPQLTTMLKGLFRGWVSSVINEKANKDLRDAQIRDKPMKAQPFLLPPPRHLRNP